MHTSHTFETQMDKILYVCVSKKHLELRFKSVVNHFESKTWPLRYLHNVVQKGLNYSFVVISVYMKEHGTT